MSINHGFDEAFERVKELAAIFKQNEQRYQSVGYSEAQARKDFIYQLYDLTPEEIAIVEASGK